MTRYAIDEERGVLLAVWASGVGDLACSVAALPDGCAPELSRALAHTLSNLSRTVWRTYTHPASAAAGAEPNREGWRRKNEREAFADVALALREPNLPEDGLMLQSAVHVTEGAHHVGRVLHAIGDGALTDTVAREVERELAAVESAELGDLTARAAQAVALTREDVSPAQVAAADRILREDPFGDDRLFTGIDPAAAAVAAAHWLRAAADAAADVSGLEAVDVVAEADDIESLAAETPTTVLELMADGATPRQAVTALIRGAMLVAEGFVPNPAGLARAVADAVEQGERLGRPASHDASPAGIRATPLDPARPALDLLEDLLAGIRGCWLVYHEYTADAALNAGLTGEDLDEGQVDAAGSQDGDETDDEARTAAFLDLVRTHAAARNDRLA